MDQNATIEEGEGRNGLELIGSVSDKQSEFFRPSAQYYFTFKGQAMDVADRKKGRYTLIRDEENSQVGTYDKPLPCFGCGIGWFSFLVGFLCPLMWYYATILYFGNYYHKDPRERAGLAASAISVSRYLFNMIGLSEYTVTSNSNPEIPETELYFAGLGMLRVIIHNHHYSTCLALESLLLLPLVQMVFTKHGYGSS